MITYITYALVDNNSEKYDILTKIMQRYYFSKRTEKYITNPKKKNILCPNIAPISKTRRVSILTHTLAKFYEK